MGTSSTLCEEKHLSRSRRWCRTWRQAKLIRIRKGLLHSKIFCMHAAKAPISMRMHFPCRPSDRKSHLAHEKKAGVCEWVTWDLYEHRAKLIACVAVTREGWAPQPRIRWTTTCVRAVHACRWSDASLTSFFPWAAIRIFHRFSLSHLFCLYFFFVLVLAWLFACWSLCVF